MARLKSCPDTNPSTIESRYTRRCAKIAASLWSIDVLIYTSFYVSLLNMVAKPDSDNALIEEARHAGKHGTKKEAITAALGEYVKRREQLRILEAFGRFEFDPGYDYKAERRGCTGKTRS